MKMNMKMNMKIDYRRSVLTEITPAKYPDLKSEYIDTAKAFHTLFRNNLIEAGASTTIIDKAKGTWIDPIRLMIESDGYTIDDLRDVFQF